jgi:hypothetical protein
MTTPRQEEVSILFQAVVELDQRPSSNSDRERVTTIRILRKESKGQVDVEVTVSRTSSIQMWLEVLLGAGEAAICKTQGRGIVVAGSREAISSMFKAHLSNTQGKESLLRRVRSLRRIERNTFRVSEIVRVTIVTTIESKHHKHHSSSKSFQYNLERVVSQEVAWYILLDDNK